MNNTNLFTEKQKTKTKIGNTKRLHLRLSINKKKISNLFSNNFWR